MTEDDRRRTAYHESGHALVGMLTRARTPCARSRSSRARWRSASRSRPRRRAVRTTTSDYLLGRIKVALGGRVAEEVVYGTITAGAESDIQQLTGDRAPDGRALGHERGDRADRGDPLRRAGPAAAGRAEISERTQQMIDAEVRRIVDEEHADVTALLTEHRDKLDSLAEAPARRRDARRG